MSLDCKRNPIRHCENMQTPNKPSLSLGSSCCEAPELTTDFVQSYCSYSMECRLTQIHQRKDFHNEITVALIFSGCLIFVTHLATKPSEMNLAVASDGPRYHHAVRIDLINKRTEYRVIWLSTRAHINGNIQWMWCIWVCVCGSVEYMGGRAEGIWGERITIISSQPFTLWMFLCNPWILEIESIGLMQSKEMRYTQMHVSLHRSEIACRNVPSATTLQKKLQSSLNVKQTE